ncbi:hypothetical protein SUNI508_08751 [Seiridium unicorne]|uniref:Uncharacterized protein n=1 Tax=Seiridium unicorne TaxID=138068 RepID=A0ABR2US37_9PEZI
MSTLDPVRPPVRGDQTGTAKAYPSLQGQDKAKKQQEAQVRLEIRRQGATAPWRRIMQYWCSLAKYLYQQPQGHGSTSDAPSTQVFLRKSLNF